MFRVRHIGVSNHSVSQLQRLQAIHPVLSLQPPYSMIAREVEVELLPWCGSQQIGVLFADGEGIIDGCVYSGASGWLVGTGSSLS
jgi:aryl-alcohol dehydrogenase-like predicted oxidoreductase